MKRKYYATIEETVTKTFEVEAESIDEAYEIAVHNYDICEFVLDPGELVAKRISVDDYKNYNPTNWVEF